MTVPAVNASPDWPWNIRGFYRPTVIAALAACVFGIVGSLGPWVGVFTLTLNGLDCAWWGVTTMTTSAVSGLALILLLLWGKTTLDGRYTVPLAWLVAVFAVGSVAIALPFVLRILTTGPSVGWGLWLLGFAGIVQLSTATTVAVRLSRAVNQLTPAGQSPRKWTTSWAATAGACAVLILLSSGVHFARHWEYPSDTDSRTAPEPSFPSFTMPSLPSFAVPSPEVPTPSPSSSPPPPTASDALSAATAAEQEKMDRRTQRDFAGEWLLFTKVLREGISQRDYVRYSERCTPNGLGRITVTGVLIDADGRAIVRTELLGSSKIKKMAFEEGAWHQVPDDFLLTNLGKTGDELVAADKALGHCVLG